jgi:hypothetical protein
VPEQSQNLKKKVFALLSVFIQEPNGGEKPQGSAHVRPHHQAQTGRIFVSISND